MKNSAHNVFAPCGKVFYINSNNADRVVDAHARLCLLCQAKKRNGEFRVDVEIKPIKENMARLSKIDPHPHHHPISKLIDQERAQVDPNWRTQN